MSIAQATERERLEARLQSLEHSARMYRESGCRAAYLRVCEQIEGVCLELERLEEQ